MKTTGFANARNAIARSKRAASDRFACRCVAVKRLASTAALMDSTSFSCAKLTVSGFASLCTMGFAVLLFCWAVCLSPQVAYAEAASTQTQSQSQSLSLTIHCVHDDANVPGVSVSIYRVATVGEDGSFQPVAPFDAYPVLWSAATVDEARALATTLEGLILRDGVAPTDAATTNANGIAAFPSSRMLLAGDSGSGLTEDQTDGGPSDGQTGDGLSDGQAGGGQSSDSQGGASSGSTAGATGLLEPGVYLVMGQEVEHAGALYVPQSMLITLPSQNDDGALNYAPIVRMKNETLPVDGKTSLDVTKVWVDATNTVLGRPDSITVQLLCDGQVVQTVRLSDENGWHVLFSDLPSGHRWSVIEAEVPEGFVTSVSQQGTNVTITNTRTTPEEPPITPDNPDNPNNPGDKLPQTGQLWWPVPPLVIAGIALVAAGIFRSRKS